MVSAPQPGQDSIWARFVGLVKRWLGFSELTAEDIKFTRHSKFCMAIPFPHLSWKADEDPEIQLSHLHDYVVQLANSALDWYLRKKHRKKIFAKILHYATYASGIAAAGIPLFMLLAPEFDVFTRHVGNYKEFAAEVAIGFIAIAGGFNVIDRVSGYTADWMRYMLTASDLQRALVEFQFQWSEMTQAAAHPQEEEPAKKSATHKHTDWTKKRIDLAHNCTRTILGLIAGETEKWAKEQQERVEKMASWSGRS
jgi:hypothetical protein